MVLTTAIESTATPKPAQDTQPKELSLKERIGAYNPDGSVKWLNSLFYAEPGGGKTYLFGSVADWPEEFLPALLIDLDGGVDTLRFKKEIEISPPIRSLKDLQKLYKEIAAEPNYYKTIGLDNISELQKMDMNQVMLEAKNTANDSSKVDIHVPSQREWGKNGERMRIIIRAFRDLPCHTICLAHISEREDKITKVPGLWPGMPGQMRHEILGFFSVGGFLSVYEQGGEVHRQIQFKKTKKVQARDRFQVLPDLMTNDPTIPQIWKIIKESGAVIKQDDPLVVPTQGIPAQAVPTATHAQQLQAQIGGNNA